MENFDPKKDKIAVVIKDFTLKKKSEFFFDRYSEPYILSMAIDQDGANNPAIDFNVLPYPNVRQGQTVSFNGQGHLLYGPKNPKEFLAYTVLFLESDKDIRTVGDTIEEIVTSEAVNIGAKAILVANPAYGTAITLLTSIVELVAKQMKKNRDDELFRQSGTLLRDVIPPYDILRSYTSENDFIKTTISIIPLQVSNKMGSQCKRIVLQ